MLNIPDKSMFPGTGPNGNGMATAMKSQLQWLDQVKTNGCYGCHQLGNKATRTIPKELGTFKNSVEAWERRVQSGQAMLAMANALGRQETKIAISNLANCRSQTLSARPGVDRQASLDRQCLEESFWRDVR